MVDELGGIDAAIADAAGRAGLKPGEFEIRVLPAPKTLADMLGFGSASFQGATIRIQADSVLHLIPESARSMILQHVQLSRLLEVRPVVLISPYTLRVR
jgi:hypothetical protein